MTGESWKANQPECYIGQSPPEPICRGRGGDRCGGRRQRTDTSLCLALFYCLTPDSQRLTQNRLRCSKVAESAIVGRVMRNNGISGVPEADAGPGGDRNVGLGLAAIAVQAGSTGIASRSGPVPVRGCHPQPSDRPLNWSSAPLAFRSTGRTSPSFDRKPRKPSSCKPFGQSSPASWRSFW
ncbi:hypothetical protein K227x_59430 [Rubripirellula lacrimiformis]|uniref:Uncharacterized protein n=1 Tax=Rubripirellula lacrimiformis TaxID=1930273 RepID=A0A517NK48_9BACT|nr:hypothetical protein K227x_59430 [Rubripirellula lacrimiformis]